MLQVGGRSAFMTFWDRLEKSLDENNLTASELCRTIGVASSVVYSWKVRDSIPRADIAVKVAEQLNTTVEYLVSGNNFKKITNTERNSFLVPILNQELSAGHGDLLPDYDIVNGFIRLPSFTREYGEKLAGLFVHGDSMENTLKNGDLVICATNGWDNGEGLYAIRLNGNGYVKRIQVATGKIIIRSDNPKYSPIEEPIESDNLSIIGRVIMKIQRVD